MRYVIYGAGAVGGTIGAELQLAGRDVVFIARGRHYEAMRTHGLHYETPGAAHDLRVEVADHPSGIAFRDGDVVLLCVKSQDTPAALDALRAAAGTDIPVVCAQNGVENERMALRRFARVYAMVVMLPGTHMEPGVVLANSAPYRGILDTGVYPSGVDSVVEQLTADLEAVHFSARPTAKIMRLKYTKLLLNMVNTYEAVTNERDDALGLIRRARSEARACFQAAGIDFADDTEWTARRADYIRPQYSGLAARAGSSSLQSLLRGTGTIETDYLDGEVVLLGRLHGVPTPVAAALQAAGARMVAEGLAPGAFTAAQIAAAAGLD